MHTQNDYELFLLRRLRKQPSKAVLAAIVLSLAARLSGDDLELGARLVQSEWETLYQNDIIPQ